MEQVNLMGEYWNDYGSNSGDAWDGGANNQGQEEWHHIGALRMAPRKASAVDNLISGSKYGFDNIANKEDDDEEVNMKVNINDAIVWKCKQKKNKTVRVGARGNEKVKSHVVVVTDEHEMDKIIDERRNHAMQGSDNKRHIGGDEMINKNMSKIINGDRGCKCCRRHGAGDKDGLKALTIISNDSIGQCSNKQNEWKKVSLTVDSGACENVMDVEEALPGYEVKPSKASINGVKYASATGEEIPNLGEVVLPIVTPEGGRCRIKMQAAEVSKPLASVKRICQTGHIVVFDEDGSYIYNKASGSINHLREEGGNYMLDVWVPPNNPRGFPGQ